MRPFDPKFARAIQPVRSAIISIAILASITAVALAIQAIYLARFIAEIFVDRNQAAFSNLIVVAIAWGVRVLATSAQDAFSRNSGLKAVADSRLLVLQKISQLPTRSLPIEQGALVSLLTKGLNGIEIYVARYLPQLVVTIIVPLILGAVVFSLDPLAAIIIFVTIPLIPLFMTLVGWFTQDNVKLHWDEVTRLSARILDLLNGLPELKIFNRAKQQASVIRNLSESQKVATMRVLRLSFLSAFVLELLATISVALVAVAIGLRLVEGEMQLAYGLAALMLAPEIFLPLRMLGVHFHAAVEGVEAWEQVKTIISVPGIQRGQQVLHNPQSISWQKLEVKFKERLIAVPDGALSRGEIVVLKGASGIGKSTFLDVLAGFLQPNSGDVDVKIESEVSDYLNFSLDSWQKNVTYVAADSPLTSGKLREILLIGNSTEFSDVELRAHLERLHLDMNLERDITDRDQGISVGQRHRIALVRALLRNPSFIFVDEPDAALDQESVNVVVQVLSEVSQSGTGVLIVTHSNIFDDIATRTIEFERVSK